MARNPLVSIWLEPRETLRFILSTDEGLFVHTLAILAAITATLSQVAGKGLGDMFALPVILLFAVCGSLILGPLQLYLLSAMVTFTGSFFGGRGRFGEVRAALAWGGLPMVVSLLLLWIPCLLIFGHDMFISNYSAIAARPAMATLAMIAIVLHGGLILWTLYITIATVSEAHQVSLLAGAFTLGLAWLIFVVVTAIAILVALGVFAIIAHYDAAEEARRLAEPLPAPHYLP